MNSKKPSLGKRLFAYFMRKSEQNNYDRYKDRKERLFKNISGTVLELGPGTGANFQFLTNVNYMAIEPNNAMYPYLFKKAKDFGIKIKLYAGMSSKEGIKNNSVDVVISTLVLCSVKDLTKTLHEIKRVLKPGGRFIFLEHVADKKGTFRRSVQTIINHTPWNYFADGCRPNREIAKAIKKTGFKKVDCKKYLQKGPGIILAILRPHIYGVAIK